MQHGATIVAPASRRSTGETPSIGPYLPDRVLSDGLRNYGSMTGAVLRLIDRSATVMVDR
jgi:hypothetical protein